MLAEGLNGSRGGLTRAGGLPPIGRGIHIRGQLTILSASTLPYRPYLRNSVRAMIHQNVDI